MSTQGQVTRGRVLKENNREVRERESVAKRLLLGFLVTTHERERCQGQKRDSRNIFVRCNAAILPFAAARGLSRPVIVV